VGEMGDEQIDNIKPVVDKREEKVGTKTEKAVHL
jgi:hypothetical protein